MLKIKNYIFLTITFFVYSLSLLFSKIASMQENSFNFILYYIISVLIMCVYAILWQLILKNVPLSIAFHKTVTIVFFVSRIFYIQWSYYIKNN